MALGGGTFTTQNKVLPGSYINFVSVKSASSALSDRGVATMSLELDWGVDKEVFAVSNEAFQKDSLKLFGYDYTHEKLKGLRDLFKNIKTLYAYRLNGGGIKASNAFATAKYSGTRGNSLKIVIKANVDTPSKYDVSTYLDTLKLDTQTVAQPSELVANDFVTFKSDSTLAVTAGTPLTAGTNGTVDGNAHKEYLSKIESFTFNAMGVVATDATVKGLYENFCKRLRDDLGVKFQAILYNKASDHEGVINVKNKVTDTVANEASLVYWVTGAIAGCEVNKSVSNRIYDGEFAINTDYSQAQLEDAIQKGEFVLHRVNSEIRVLEDINSLVSVTEEKKEVFKDNQTIRVVDQIANDIAVLFATKYLGKIPNDADGRISLWADIVKHHQQLEDMRAIENFDEKEIVISEGDHKKSIVIKDAISVIGTMSKLYMTVSVA